LRGQSAARAGNPETGKPTQGSESTVNSERLGKILISVNLALSLLFLAWATAAYVQAIDWGWKDKRKNVLGTPEPSELDKRKVLVERQNVERDRAEIAWKAAL